MPFDRLQGGQITPPQYHPMVLPPPPVYDTQKVVEHGVDQINKIIDTFSPLSVAERKAKLAQATLLMKATQLAQQGHPEMLAMLKDPLAVQKMNKLALGIKGQQLSNQNKALYGQALAKKLQGTTDPNDIYRTKANVKTTGPVMQLSGSEPPPPEDYQEPDLPQLDAPQDGTE